MTKRTRRKIDASLKAKIALEALRDQVTVADVAQHYQVHPNPTTLGRSILQTRRRGHLKAATQKGRLSTNATLSACTPRSVSSSWSAIF
jgi:transposase-like protein